MPEQPLHDIQIVQALVQQHAAAFALPGRPPAAAGIIGLGAKPIGHDPAHAHDLAQFAALDQLLDFQIPRLGAQLKHAGEDQLGILFAARQSAVRRRLCARRSVFRPSHARLLQRGDAEGGMLIMRRGDDHRIDRPERINSSPSA